MAFGAKDMSLRIGVDYVNTGMKSLFDALDLLDERLKKTQELLALNPAGRVRAIADETAAIVKQNVEREKGLGIEERIRILREEAIRKVTGLTNVPARFGQEDIKRTSALARVDEKGNVSTSETFAAPGGWKLKQDVSAAGGISLTGKQDLAREAREEERIRNKELGQQAAYHLAKYRAEERAGLLAQKQDVDAYNRANENATREWNVYKERNRRFEAENAKQNTQNAQYQMAKIKDETKYSAERIRIAQQEEDRDVQIGMAKIREVAKREKIEQAANAKRMADIKSTAIQEDKIRTQMANQGYKTMMTEAQFQNRVMTEQIRQARTLETVRAFRRQQGVEILPVQRTVADTGQMQNVVRLYNSSTGELLKYNVATKTASLSTRQLGEETKRAGDTIQSSIGKVLLWSIATGAVYGTIRAVKGSLVAFAQVETATTALARTGRGFSSALDPIRQQFEMIAGAKNVTEEVLKLSVAFGVSADEAMQASMTFSRLGLSQSETIEATRVAIMAANVAYIDTATAAKLLTSAMQQFGLGVRDLPALLNHLNSLENTTNVRTVEMLNAISRAGTVFRDAGGSIEQFSALTAVVAQATGRSGAEIGNAFKTIASRLGSADIQMQIFKNTGVEIADSFGNIKPIMQILNELSFSFDKLSDAQRNETAISAAGIRQRNFLQTALDRIVDIQAKVVVQYSDVNSAAKENALVMETLAKKGQQVSAAYTRMSYEIGKSGAGSALGFFADRTKEVLSLIADYPNLTMTATTALGLYGIAMLNATSTGGQLGASIAGLNKSFVAANVGIINHIRFMVAGTATDTTATMAKALYTKQLIASGIAQEAATLQTNVATAAQLANAAATAGAFARIGVAAKALGASIWAMTGPIAVVIAAIMAGVAAWAYFANAGKRAIEAQEEAFKKLDDTLKERTRESDLAKAQADLWDMTSKRIVRFEKEKSQGISHTNREIMAQARYLQYAANLGVMTPAQKARLDAGTFTRKDTLDVAEKLRAKEKETADLTNEAAANSLETKRIAVEAAEKEVELKKGMAKVDAEEKLRKARESYNKELNKGTRLVQESIDEEKDVVDSPEIRVGKALAEQDLKRKWSLDEAAKSARRVTEAEKDTLDKLREEERIMVVLQRRAGSIRYAAYRASQPGQREFSKAESDILVNEASAIPEKLMSQKEKVRSAALEKRRKEFMESNAEEIKLRDEAMNKEVANDIYAAKKRGASHAELAVLENEARQRVIREEMVDQEQIRDLWAKGTLDREAAEKRLIDLHHKSKSLETEALSTKGALEAEIEEKRKKADEDALKMLERQTEERRRQAEQVEKMLGRMSDEELLQTAIFQGRVKAGEVQPGAIDIMRTTERQRRFLTEQGEMNQTSYFNQSGIQATITANRIAEQQAAFTPEQVQAGMAQVRQKREIEEANLALIRAAREARTPAGAAFSPAAQGMTVNVGNVSGQFEQLASAINVRVTAGITATLASFLATVEAAPKLVAKAQPPVRVQ